MDIQMETSRQGQGKGYRCSSGSHWHTREIANQGQVRPPEEKVLMEGRARGQVFILDIQRPEN